MDKLRMQTANKADDNFKKLAEMFPNAVTETVNENGEVVRAIDKDVLMQEISCKVVDGNEERYQFTWPDKKKSVLLANAPINKTLRPVREDETVPTGADSEGKPYCSTGSVDFDTTENLYIEGDNLEVLKLLQETYLGKIKMIYIDPPYNTGNDFVYNDEFGIRSEEWNGISGNYDADGNQIVGALERNTEANGRFHTDWLNMVYPRLKLAKDLLRDDGVIFISIDDNEQENLKKCCDEVFGAHNFIAQLVWEKKKKGAFLSKNYINMKEYIVVYAKNNATFAGLIGEVTSKEETYPCIKTTNARGIRVIKKGVPSKYKEKNYTIAANTRISSGNMELIYLDDVVIIDGILQNDIRVDSNWIYGQEALNEFTRSGLLYITQDNYIRRVVNDERIKMLKDLLTRVGSDGRSLATFEYDKNMNNGGWGTNEDANDELHKLLGQQYLFDFSKPSRLVAKLAQSVTAEKDIILDFFSGSATTAHAIMQLNVEDGGHRKFIMVQLPEATDEKSEAYKAGYKTICEIGKERIRRAGKKIREENTDNSSLLTPNSKLDTGFRVLKCDTSNMKDVYYNPAEYEVNMFSRLEDNIKEDRTPEDLLFQVMLDLGVLLSSKVEETTIAGKKVFNVEDNYLIACFDSDVSEETIKAIAKQKPYYFVMRDSSMASDSVATNFDQIFATYSPDTVRKVL